MRQGTKGLIFAAQQRRQEEAAQNSAAVPLQAALPEASGSDIMGALKERAAANGLQIDDTPQKTDTRTPFQKALQSPSPSGFDAQMRGDIAAEGKARRDRDDVMSWEAEHAAWERAENERQAKMQEEHARTGRVDMSKYPATPMPRPPMRTRQQGDQMALNAETGEFGPAEPGATDVQPFPGPMRDTIDRLKDWSRENRPPEAANYQAAIAALREAKAGGPSLRSAGPLADKVAPIKDKAGRVVGSKVTPANIAPRTAQPQKFRWADEKGVNTTDPKRFSGGAEISGPGTKAAPKGGKKGGDARPLNDAQRQIDAGGARMSEELRLLDAGILPPTEERNGPPRLPAAPAATPTRIRPVPVPAAGDEADPSQLTEEQRRAFRGGRYVPAPMAGEGGKDVVGLRAISKEDWAALHAGDRKGETAHPNLVLMRLADKLGIPVEMPEGQRIAKAKVYYDEQKRLRENHDIVELPTGGHRFVPNSQMEYRIERRKNLATARKFLQAHPFEGDGRSTDHAEEILKHASGDTQAMYDAMNRVRNSNMIARNAAARNNSNLRGRLQNLRSPTLGPALAAQEMQDAHLADEPSVIAATQAGLGDFAGAGATRSEEIQRKLSEAAIEAEKAGHLGEAALTKRKLDLQERALNDAEKTATNERLPHLVPKEARRAFYDRLDAGDFDNLSDADLADEHHALILNEYLGTAGAEPTQKPTKEDNVRHMVGALSQRHTLAPNTRHRSFVQAQAERVLASLGVYSWNGLGGRRPVEEVQRVLEQRIGLPANHPASREIAQQAIARLTQGHGPAAAAPAGPPPEYKFGPH